MADKTAEELERENAELRERLGREEYKFDPRRKMREGRRDPNEIAAERKARKEAGLDGRR